VADSSDDSPTGVGIETAALPEGTNTFVREPGGGGSGQRRNTGARKHSPSNAAAEQAAQTHSQTTEPEESIEEFGKRFDTIRQETDEIAALIVKDLEEFRSQMRDLTKERDEKKQTLKEKEEASERLRKEVRDSERAHRLAQTKKLQKEKTLKQKQAERTKMQNDLVRWREEIETMKAERKEWLEQRKQIIEEKETKAEKLRETIRQHQSSVSGLEEEIRAKGRQVDELKKERENLPGSQDDDESRERDAAERQRDSDWEIRERDLRSQLNQHTMTLRAIKQELNHYQKMYQSLSTHPAISTFMYPGNSSSVDFDPTGGQGTAKRRRSRHRTSRTNTISSTVAGFSINESSYPNSSTYNNLNNMISPTFAQGPYYDLSSDIAMVPLAEQMHLTGMSEADVRALTSGAPLSPNATNLLPAELFNDDDPPSPNAESMRSSGPALYANDGSAVALQNDPQSPVPSRSPSLMPSPQTSLHNLAKYGVASHDFSPDTDRLSLNSPKAAFGAIGSPSGSDQATPQKRSKIFTFPRARGKTMQEDGPALGSLKQGQSQSFPRSTEEPEAISNRQRRTSLSTWNMPSFLTRGSAVGDASEGNGPAPARNAGARRRRGFNMFGSNGDEPSGILLDRDPSSPRPLSIASSDLPRPSTDSAPFGWPAALDGSSINRNSPLATNWSINVAPTNWSRNPSRRPSIQHGSTTALTSGIASDDDDFLPSESLAGQSSPPPVGVIGTRPPSSHKPVTPKLNPAAPTFKIFSRTKGKDKGVEPATSSQPPENISTTSSAEPRRSRDTTSVHTQNSMAESYESLDRTSSNTTSEMTNPSATSTKEKESSFQKLLRKGSSSKFSLSSIRNIDSGLFGGKKGTPSATNSDRTDRESSLDGFGDESGLGKSVDSVTSSPMIGSLGKEKDSGTPKEGRKSVNWGRAFGMKKDKNKSRESSEISRSEAETTGTEDEGGA
jgi:hypothetical protein